jgi:hypothetical protein
MAPRVKTTTSNTPGKIISLSHHVMAPPSKPRVLERVTSRDVINREKQTIDFSPKQLIVFLVKKRLPRRSSHHVMSLPGAQILRWATRFGAHERTAGRHSGSEAGLYRATGELHRREVWEESCLEVIQAIQTCD